MSIHDAALQTGGELKGKVALVTGATKNIGRAIARSLASAGAAVAVNSRASKEDGERVVAEIRKAGGTAECFIADIADGAQVEAMVKGITERFGGVDILVLNASVRKKTPITEMSFEEWRRIMAISLDGSFHCVKACLPTMTKRRDGAIVTLGGMMALAGAKDRVHGSVVKHGLVGMTRALALDLADYGIRVNCIAPGQMNTPPAGEPVVVPAPSKTVPLGRKGEPEEIAAAVRFLCGPGASFISGQTIHVNGAQMMY
ncbi:MAG TPA: SDR family NAD(P)-dependent oxidoreductase [Burkholderiales bacterium]|nr:SDR family NAD(P)-dependent oxidoreductase [Burkholderiales bacterium]